MPERPVGQGTLGCARAPWARSVSNFEVGKTAACDFSFKSWSATRGKAHHLGARTGCRKRPVQPLQIQLTIKRLRSRTGQVITRTERTSPSRVVRKIELTGTPFR